MNEQDFTSLIKVNLAKMLLIDGARLRVLGLHQNLRKQQQVSNSIKKSYKKCRTAADLELWTRRLNVTGMVNQLEECRSLEKSATHLHVTVDYSEPQRLGIRMPRQRL